MSCTQGLLDGCSSSSLVVEEKPNKWPSGILDSYNVEHVQFKRQQVRDVCYITYRVFSHGYCVILFYCIHSMGSSLYR